MTRTRVEKLEALADVTADRFQSYRDPEEFKEISIVINNSDPEHPTLIVHVENEEAEELAKEVEEFLESQGAWTERETYPDEIRVLATVE